MTGKGEGEQESWWQGQGHSPAGAAKKYPGRLRADRGVTLGSASEWLKAAWVVSFPCPEDANKKAEACGERQRPPCLQMEPSGGPGPGGGCSGSDTDNPRRGSEPPRWACNASSWQNFQGATFLWLAEGGEGQGRAAGISIGSK